MSDTIGRIVAAQMGRKAIVKELIGRGGQSERSGSGWGGARGQLFADGHGAAFP